MVVTDRDAVVPAPALMKRVSWGAIFAGAVSTVALTALLGLLGLGIGFGTFDPSEGDSLRGVPKATLAWWAVISIVATGIGGFVAARLAGIPRSMTGALHGLAVWSVATLLTLWLATTAVGTLLGAATSVVTTTARVTTSAVGTAGGAVIDAGGAVAPSQGEVEAALREQGVTRDRIRSEAEAMLSAAGVTQRDVEVAQNAAGTAAENILMQPGTAGEELDRLIDRLFEGPGAALSPQERDALVTELAQRAGVSRGEAEQIAGRWEQQAAAATERVRRVGGTTIERTGERALELSDEALSVLSQVAWGMFLISLAGLVAALLGAALGAPSLGIVAAGAAHRDEYDRDYPPREDRPPPR